LHLREEFKKPHRSLGHGAKNSFFRGMGEASFFEVGGQRESMDGEIEEEDGSLEEAAKEIES
jgi:hypothetical protein